MDVMPVEAALKRFVRDHAVVVTAMAASEPGGFFSGVHQVLQDCTGVVIWCANPSRSYEVFHDQSLDGRVELRPLFLTASVRDHQSQPHVHYVPQHLSQWVRNILFRCPKIDLFWGSCSVPDSRGFVSLGPGVCYEAELLRKAEHVVLEINPAIPFTHGATTVPLRMVSAFVERSGPLPESLWKQPDEEDQKIAAFVADLIQDGSTLQLGIGSIPDALTDALMNKKHLGIHTEMINNSIQKLIEAGVVDGSQKTIWPDKVVGSFAFGTAELYQFLDRNPVIELHPASVVVDPWRIGRNHRMVSVNSAVEIDMTGQVCSESIGHLELSGIGGAFDTHTGAQRSPDGRGIIALKSTTRQGVSKIVSELQPGAKVSISRNDLDTVVTEYGVAELKGRSVAARAEQLIAVAHPSFRDQLRYSARKNGYL
ncbi:MAG: 4-hydroxybutyrate--acetyl-CoA CoA transferase [Deltaproteobacteria bacterium]|nr:4-hydroxybutyrate--acetyl-CoA CoA transferase [Deltaproteobacteria bacterium]